MIVKKNPEPAENEIYDRSKEEQYWLNKFVGELNISNFPYDFSVINNDQISMETEVFSIEGEVYNSLLKLSNNSDFRLYMILLTGMNVLMEKYTGNKDIIIGTTVLKQDIEGEFINTILALRSEINSEMTFKETLLQTRQDFVDAIENQNYSINSLIYKLKLNTEERTFPLFSNALLLLNIHDENYLKDIILDTKIVMENTGEALIGRFIYNSALYEKNTVKRIIEYYTVLLQKLVSNLDIKLSDIDILTDKEKDIILNQFNRPIDLKIPDMTIIELFDEQVEKYPDKIACEYGPHTITYGELNQRANLLANILIERSIEKESIVAILMDRSIEMIISILGIIKAGGAYLTIDKNYPEERIDFLLENSKSFLVITNKHYANYTIDKEILLYEDISFDSVFKNQIVRNYNADDLLYVIFTSGSTGNPKGVLIENKGCVNMVTVHQNIFENNCNSRVSQVASCSFDAMAFEIWPCLTTGGNLCIVDDDTQKDPFRMKEWLIKNQINITYQPTYMAELLLEDEWSLDRLSLKSLRVAGDLFRRNLLKKYPFKVFNLYGPTEDTVWTTYIELSSEDNPSKIPPIGKPINNKRVYILNESDRLQPIGVNGELCISGIGLAREYLNDSELTKKKFISNNFEKNGKLYKTGDNARWLPDGNIEFINRKDHQVKIRGYRIELREVELCLLNHPDIQEVVVIVCTNTNEDKFLCAYYVSEKKLSYQVIRNHLSASLPDYMIPAFYVQIEQMPLMQNGKIDRKQLPQPEAVRSECYVAPRNEIEKILVDVFQKVLNVERIGINDNFFVMGGDSIKAIQISSNIQKMGLKLEIRDLFTHPQIKDLKNFVKKTNRVIPQDEVSGEVLNTPATKWFYSNFSKNINHCNQAVMLFNSERFDEEALNEAAKAIVIHHDALRMVFKNVNDQLVIYNRPVEEPLFYLHSFDLIDVNNENLIIENECNKIHESINLETGPLINFGLFKVKDGDHLLISIHHHVIDSISWRILLEDITLAYELSLQGMKINLQDKTDSYKYWTEKLNDYAISSELMNELDFWQKIDQAHNCSLKRDSKIKDIDNIRKNISTETMNLDKDYTHKLLYEVNHAYNTEINDILLAAMGFAFKRWGNMKKVLLNIEGHGRETILPDINISRTLGWFTSQYPVLLDMEISSDLSYIIRFVKESIRKIPNKGIGYGILKYLTSEKKDICFNNNAEISFNYLGEFGQELSDSYIQHSLLNTGKNISDELKRGFVLDINGILMQGIFSISIEYNNLEFKQETIQCLAEECKKALIEIINHCCEKEKSEFTPNDLGANDISIEELDIIADIISRM